MHLVLTIYDENKWITFRSHQCVGDPKCIRIRRLIIVLLGIYTGAHTHIHAYIDALVTAQASFLYFISQSYTCDSYRIHIVLNLPLYILYTQIRKNQCFHPCIGLYWPVLLLCMQWKCMAFHSNQTMNGAKMGQKDNEIYFYR